MGGRQALAHRFAHGADQRGAFGVELFDVNLRKILRLTRIDDDGKILSMNKYATRGLVLGLLFGIADLIFTWIDPLADDSAVAVLTFYVPMFAAWGVFGFSATRQAGKLSYGLKAGSLAAFITFLVFFSVNLIRVNAFLEILQRRADWQDMISRFESSGWISVRIFVNYDYLKGAPFKIGSASFIGMVMGLLGGLAAQFATWTRRVGRKSTTGTCEV
jgi:hypothetical protein